MSPNFCQNSVCFLTSSHKLHVKSMLVS
jgi:hypothetical protein